MRVMLMLSDREDISRGLAEGLQYKEIALRLGRNPSVFSREVVCPFPL
jgi:IS30 family transposase